MIISVAPLLKQHIGSHISYAFAEDPVDPKGENADVLEAGFQSIDARVTATHTDPGALLEGDASGGTDQQCSRCLRPIRVTVAANFAEQYYATVAVASDAKLDAPPVELDAKTIGSDFLIDLSPLIAEELILAMPVKPLCREDCKGLCSECGEDLNERPHEHNEIVDERWSKLSKLRDLHLDEDRNA